MAGWKEIKESAESNATDRDPRDTNVSAAAVTMQRWGGLAFFLMAVAFIVPPWIYLTGNLRDAGGPLVYALADFLYGPVWGASLVVAVIALRERIGERAARRMSLALLAALAAAAAMVGVACIRSANRQYLLMHPELPDALSTTLLMAWSTIVTGVMATGWHFLGWVLVLVGSAGWTSSRLPRGLSLLYVAAGTASLFVYLRPDMEGATVALGLMVSIWQGIVLWKGEPAETQAPRISASQPDQA
jgi:hypothetical protein